MRLLPTARAQVSDYVTSKVWARENVSADYYVWHHAGKAAIRMWAPRGYAYAMVDRIAKMIPTVLNISWISS